MTRRRALVTVWCVALILCAAWSIPAPGAKLQDAATSLKLVPESAAYYTAMLRLREQVQIVANSRAWTKLKQLPVVQMGLGLWQMQMSSPDSMPAKFMQALQDPQVREAVDLVGDMFSDEIFFFGDQTSLDTIQVLQQIQSASQFGTLQAKVANPSAEDSELQVKLMIKTLSENLSRLKVPNLVAGFKVQNTKRAAEQLAKLELLAGMVAGAEPKLAEAMKRTKLGKHEFLVLTLTGDMIPWDEVPLEKAKEVADKPGDVDKIVAQVKKMKLVITLGLHESHLILAIGPSTAVVAGLGQGTLLADRPEIKRLDAHAGQRITSLGYVSQEARSRLGNPQGQLESLLKLLDAVLPLAGLSDQQQERIRKDAKALLADVEQQLPKLGAGAAVGFLTKQGWESYGYQWGDFSRLDASRPLGLLEHVGGTPLVALVGRQKQSPADYELLVKWLKTAYGYAVDFGIPQLDADDQARVKKLLAQVTPLLERMDEVNRTMCMPALADGQCGLVIDAKLKSKQFCAEMPPADKPLPMAEPALIVGVSDAKLLRKAAGEYVTLAEKLLKAVREAAPSGAPELQLPKPKVTEVSGGELAIYALPKELGVDAAIAPTFGLSEQTAVFAISPKHAERLLASTPLKADGALADPQRNRAGAIYFRLPALIDAVLPWIEYGAKQAGVDNSAQQEMILSQVRTVLDVLKVLRSITSENYVAEGTLVEHSAVELRDIE